MKEPLTDAQPPNLCTDVPDVGVADATRQRSIPFVANKGAMMRALCAFAMAAAIAAVSVPASAGGSLANRSTIGCISHGALASQPGFATTSAAGDAFAAGVRGHAFLTEQWSGATWTQWGAGVPGGGWNAADEITSVTEGGSANSWLVGSYCSGTRTMPLLDRGEVGFWHQVPSPAPARDTVLNGVANIPRTADAWAVGAFGRYNTYPTGYRTLIELWNGEFWRQFPSPNFGSLTTSGDTLMGVAASGLRNAWAVGHFGSTPLALHWSGLGWRRSALPASFSIGELYGVATTDPNNAWAVGVSLESEDVPIVLHWNGTAWSAVASGAPACPGTYNTNYGVAARSSTNVWVVGWCQGAFTLHWNGSTWSKQATPNAASVTLYGVSIPSTSSPVAVGSGCETGTCPTTPTDIVERWNGHAWVFQSHP